MKTYFYKTITAMSLLIAAGCGVSKDVAVPENAVPAAYRFETISAAASIAQSDWKSFITDPTLATLIDSALVRNNDLLTAQQNIEIARHRLSQAKWNNVPTLNFQATASSTNPSENSLNGLSLSQFLGQHHVDDFTAAGILNWEADIWGKLKSRKKVALAQFLQTEEAGNALRTVLVSNVARGYYNLLMLDAQLDVARKNLSLSERTLQMINFRFEAGQVTSLAQQQAEAQRLVAAQLVPFLEQQVAIQENALSVLTGSFPKAIERTQNLAQLPLAQDFSAGVPSQMVALRPDVKASKYQLQEANAQVGAAKAELYPALTITATGGVNAFEASNWFTIPASLFGTVAGGITQPLFNGKRLRTQYNIAKAEREKAVIAFRQSVLIAVAEVSNALVAIEKSKMQYEAAEQRRAALEKAVGNSDLLFRSGMATYLEVIVAQDNLLQSELQVALQRKSRLDAAIELYRALGGGWK